MFLEKPTIDISTETDTYYVGENAFINSRIENDSTILCLTWQRKPQTPNKITCIDTADPKYEGSKNTHSGAILCIRNCRETDRGKYFLLAACSDGSEIISNEIDLNVIEGNCIC